QVRAEHGRERAREHSDGTQATGGRPGRKGHLSQRRRTMVHGAPSRQSGAAAAAPPPDRAREQLSERGGGTERGPGAPRRLEGGKPRPPRPPPARARRDVSGAP